MLQRGEEEMGWQRGSQGKLWAPQGILGPVLGPSKVFFREK